MKKKISLFFRWLWIRFLWVFGILILFFSFFAVKDYLADRAEPLAEKLSAVQVANPALGLVGASVDQTIQALESAGDEYSHWNPLNWMPWSEHFEISASVSTLYSAQSEWYLRAWEQTRCLLVCVLVLGVLFFFGKYIWRVLVFWGVAPLLVRGSPIVLAYHGGAQTDSLESEEGKQLVVPIPSHAEVLVRNNYVKVYDRDSLKKSTRWLAWWRFPFSSYGSGLRMMTSLKSTGKGESEVSVTDNDPDIWLSVIHLKNHPGVMVYPSLLVALVNVECLKVRSHWRLFSSQAWCMGQLRFFTVSGSGAIVVRALGGLQAVDVSHKLQGFEEGSLLAYDASLGLKTIRTDTFIPYFRGLESLLDLSFDPSGSKGSPEAKHYVYTKNTSEDAGRGVKRRGFFVMMGKLLGVC